MHSSVPDAPTRVLSAIPITPRQRAVISAAGGDLVRYAAGDSRIGEAEVWLGDGLTDRLVEGMTGLRWVQATSQGVENLLGPRLRASAAMVTNVQGMHAGVVADHTLALLLALARSLPRLVRAQDAATWLTLTGSDVVALQGSRMVVLGTGGIGRAVARRAGAFDVRVVGVNRRGGGVEGFDEVHGLDRLAETCDGATWLVVACPLTPDTRHVVDGPVLDALGAAGFLVNIGRGPVVDTGALVDALRSGRLRGAALDVFDDEPLPPASPLWALPNALLVPHVGGILPDYMDTAVDYFADNLTRYRAGRPLVSVVDKEAGY